MTVLFWDIDGTVLTTAKGGVPAWEAAVLEVTGHHFELSSIRIAGLTDYQIAVRTFELLGVDAEAATLDISLSAARFDAFLYVLDAKGNVIDLDDNSGGGDASHIVLDLDAGTYSIVATSYAGNGYAAGEYTISIR